MQYLYNTYTFIASFVQIFIQIRYRGHIVNLSRIASAACYLAWDSADASHKDWQYFPKIDFWRDYMPAEIDQHLAEMDNGGSATASIEAGESFPLRRAANVKHLKLDTVAPIFSRRHVPGPYLGRHYPKGLLVSCVGTDTIFPEDMTPFRISDMDNEKIEADFNHPLSNYDLNVGIEIKEMIPTKEELGGQCIDIVADIAMHGSGLQCRPSTLQPTLITVNSFTRSLNQDDSRFYDQPRFVQHIDSQARAHINQYYCTYIKPGMQVLDLMSSWESHLQGIDDNVQITGLGMNQEELKANPALQSHDVCDLNTNPQLPYADQSFDCVICTVSIEYLVNPVTIFQQVARVLKPGGRFIITFSDRWFPEKVIRVWTELHPYERMGLVLDYFRESGEFNNFVTESWHGWLRPADDMYFRQRRFSDPVFAVQGTRK
jgi:FKBP-type peptidyl-prolyl cis-trans isomerase 2